MEQKLILFTANEKCTTPHHSIPAQMSMLVSTYSQSHTRGQSLFTQFSTPLFHKSIHTQHISFSAYSLWNPCGVLRFSAATNLHGPGTSCHMSPRGAPLRQGVPAGGLRKGGSGRLSDRSCSWNGRGVAVGCRMGKGAFLHSGVLRVRSRHAVHHI